MIDNGKIIKSLRESHIDEENHDSARPGSSKLGSKSKHKIAGDSAVDDQEDVENSV